MQKADSYTQHEWFRAVVHGFSKNQWSHLKILDAERVT